MPGGVIYAARCTLWAMQRLMSGSPFVLVFAATLALFVLVAIVMYVVGARLVKR